MPNPIISGKPTARYIAPSDSTVRVFLRNGLIYAVDGDGVESVVTAEVLTVFGRDGEVTAETGDYAASQITNDSAVAGDTVDEALDALNDGKCPLDGNGKVPSANLPDSITGALVYAGTWDADANTPELDDTTGELGQFYVVSVGGTVNLGSGNLTFGRGDWAIHNGTLWEKIAAVDAVTSVAGKTGAVTLDTDDIGGMDTWPGNSSIDTIGTLAAGTVPVARVSGLGSAATKTAGVAPGQVLLLGAGTVEDPGTIIDGGLI